MPLIYRAKPGFTLVEMVVVAPMVLLLIGGVVAAMVHTTTIAMVMQARSQLQLDVLSALDRVEQDVRSSTLLSGSSTSLISTNLATDRSPLNSERRLIKAVGCSPATGGMPVADVLTYQTTYSISAGSLNRAVGLSGCATSPNVWQKNGSERLITNTTALTMNVTYSASGSTMNNTAKIVLSASRQTAGRTISYSGVMHVKSINIR